MQYRDPGNFNGGCSTSGYVHVDNAYRVGAIHSYPCRGVIAGSMTQGSNNKVIAHNPAPGEVPNAVLGAAGLQASFRDLTTGRKPIVAAASPVVAGSILISGSGFTSSSTVEVGGVQAISVNYVSSNDLVATVPAGVEAGMVRVTTSAGTSDVTSAGFSYDPSNSIAKNKPVTQSSTYAPMTAARAVDGNTAGNPTSGYASHTNSDQYAWWQVDLGSSKTLEAVNVYNRSDCCTSRLSNYYVFVSNSPFDTALTPVQQAAQPGVWSRLETATAGRPTTVMLPSGTQGRYVMIQLAGTNYLTLTEVEVYE